MRVTHSQRGAVNRAVVRCHVERALSAATFDIVDEAVEFVL